MTLFRPLPRRLSRLLSALVLVAWPLQMAWLVYAEYVRAGSTLAADLARYGGQARWKGIYYRGEKIGFSVSETMPTDDGYELREDGQVNIGLLGAASGARLKTVVRVDPQFALRSFEFSLDPGTGPLTVSGTLTGLRLEIRMTTLTGTRSEVRELKETPVLSINLPRRLASEGLAPGKTFELLVFDPATLHNAPMTVLVHEREVVRAAGRPLPAFKVEMRFSGITAYSWITDTGEVVREESPTGFIVATETRDRATARAVPGDMQGDLLEAVAIKPKLPRPIDDPRGVLRLKLRLSGATLDTSDWNGVGQRVTGDLIELYRSQDDPPAPDAEAARYLAPEPLIESDAPEIVAEAQKAVHGATSATQKAERLTRYVNALLDKKPTMSIPSALEVLRTKVGDCNEHTALYVAMARALGLPARIAVGLVFLRGAFYYHAWPEVFVETAPGVGRWIATDPTLNEFPADATHLRLVRGGLEKQAAVLPLIGRAEITVVELEMDPRYTPVLVGAGQRPPTIELPRRASGGRTCWSRPVM